MTRSLSKVAGLMLVCSGIAATGADGSVPCPLSSSADPVPLCADDSAIGRTLRLRQGCVTAIIVPMDLGSTINTDPMPTRQRQP